MTINSGVPSMRPKLVISIGARAVLALISVTVAQGADAGPERTRISRENTASAWTTDSPFV